MTPPSPLASVLIRTKLTRPTTGVPCVIVGGAVVVRDSEVLKDVNPGQPIRFPVQDKPRFKPPSVENWQETFLVAPTGFHGLDPFGK